MTLDSLLGLNLICCLVLKCQKLGFIESGRRIRDQRQGQHHQHQIASGCLPQLASHCLTCINCPQTYQTSYVAHPDHHHLEPVFAVMSILILGIQICASQLEVDHFVVDWAMIIFRGQDRGRSTSNLLELSGLHLGCRSDRRWRFPPDR